jgi:prepilin-type N-terminal cleavage/methylation domain-containing protein
MRRGYTLFELLVVLALLLLVAGLAVPSLESMYADYRLQAAVDQVRAKWAEARAHAVAEGRPYRFSVSADGSSFRVAPDGADFWGGGDASAPAGAPDAPLVFEDSLPRGIRFASADAGAAGEGAAPAAAAGDWSPVAVFLPDGTARNDVEILFQARYCTPILLRLRALTGGVTAHPVAAAGR